MNVLTSSRSANRAGSAAGVKVVGSCVAASVDTPRPSALQLRQPPSSTAAPSQPIDRNIHHSRAAHADPERS